MLLSRRVAAELPLAEAVVVHLETVRDELHRFCPFGKVGIERVGERGYQAGCLSGSHRTAQFDRASFALVSQAGNDATFGFGRPVIVNGPTPSGALDRLRAMAAHRHCACDG